LARNIAKKRDINDRSFAHLTLIMLLHYLVKCRSCILNVYNNEFCWVLHAGSENYCETRKSLKIGYFFNINQEQVYRSLSRTSTNWIDASTASGPLWVTRLLNVL